MSSYEKKAEWFGKRVKELRTQNGYSQERFAQATDIDRSYYGRIERGQANPTLKNIAAIADVLGLSISELFAETTKASRRKG